MGGVRARASRYPIPALGAWGFCLGANWVRLGSFVYDPAAGNRRKAFGGKDLRSCCIVCDWVRFVKMLF